MFPWGRDHYIDAGNLHRQRLRDAIGVSSRPLQLMLSEFQKLVHECCSEK
jgi:hypothetical protein